ncbi:GC-rich sequence DNA-binding factor-like protein-domain-containing protein [Protomyces lactucae-debilis]|uniref:GC-rich sequence DNA-binding factor-like protein-domain-containing protein n=1 Tax=Protomyces lactucae-debilis TaxID=2754530 RepID=A0A1Y2FH72_PROLT|nr:GC-rich sequence DNA-binding factor-like protein-domain-containing protein [Protomyces lactucae-debilis]ORY83279.1 GC-rich sequence DNA-binding factor-like protein-domain-containing protein [Protomyces lactucae-debilis]
MTSRKVDSTPQTRKNSVSHNHRCMAYTDSSDSDNNSEDSDGQRTAGFGYPAAKRRRTKESTMLGVFGSDSEDEDTRLMDKTMRNKAPTFQQSSTLGSEEVLERHSPPPASFARATPVSASATIPASRPAVRPSAFGQFEDEPSAKTQQRHSFAQTNAPMHKSDKQAASKLKSSKGARMMAMMGYKEGTGLGVGESGIVNPIEAQQRTEAKAGLGAGAEDEPKREKSRKHGKARTTPLSGTLEDGYDRRSDQPKLKYKTAQEVIKEAGGNLPLPPALSNLLDMTGEQPKLIVDGAQRFTTGSANQANEEADRSFQLSQVARREVEMQAVNWKTLQDRKQHTELEIRRCRLEMESLKADVEKLEQLVSQCTALDLATEDDEEEKAFAGACNQLASLRFSTADSERFKLDQLCLSILVPMIRRMLPAWDPLKEPGKFDAIYKLRHNLRVADMFDESITSLPGRNSTSWETFMYTVWFPKIRSVLNVTAWQIEDSPRAVTLLEHWQDLTPPFLKAQILSQLISNKLVATIKDWNPRKTSPGPLSWVFEWLPYYGPQAVELMDPLKQKFGSILRSWQSKEGKLADLKDWQMLLGGATVQAMLVTTVLPKLASSLRHDFEVDPGDQEMSLLENVLSWATVFDASIMSKLLEAELFPKWYEVLHLWLSSDGNFEEISQWYEWWQSVIPPAVLAQPEVKACFNRGLQLMSHALDHGADKLPALKVGPQKPLGHAAEVKRQSTQRQKKIATEAIKTYADEAQDITFKDAVEFWCEEQGFFLIPLRRAHEESGKSLFKLSASPKGQGGVTVYFQGDLLMLVKSDQTVPVGLEEVGALLKKR